MRIDVCAISCSRTDQFPCGWPHRGDTHVVDAEGSQHIRRLKRRAGAGRARRHSDVLQRHQQTLACTHTHTHTPVRPTAAHTAHKSGTFDKAEGKVEVARVAGGQVAVEVRVRDARLDLCRGLSALAPSVGMQCVPGRTCTCPAARRARGRCRGPPASGGRRRPARPLAASAPCRCACRAPVPRSAHRSRAADTEDAPGRPRSAAAPDGHAGGGAHTAHQCCKAESDHIRDERKGSRAKYYPLGP
jgi:hypothetical protein